MEMEHLCKLFDKNFIDTMQISWAIHCGKNSRTKDDEEKSLNVRSGLPRTSARERPMLS